MDCSSARELLPPYFDDELDRATGRELEAHLDGCVDCAAALTELDALRRTLRTRAPRYTAPLALRERLQSLVSKPLAVQTRRMPQRWLAMAASWALALIVGGATVSITGTQGAHDADQLARDLFSSHWRALAATSPVDVISTDRHTVKPWFAGKVAQAPVVQDFAEQGFALVGGRIDYVGSERVPVLAYRHGQHLIDVFVLPQESAAGMAKTIQRQGYSLEAVALGGQAAAIVSDMDESERVRFKQMLAAAK
ncbi:MAG: zf-HC2 domain-containing protein [Dokdonella sp.]